MLHENIPYDITQSDIIAWAALINNFQPQSFCILFHFPIPDGPQEFCYCEYTVVCDNKHSDMHVLCTALLLQYGT